LLAAGIDWDDTHELADCFAEDAAPFAEGLTIFKSVGMATADIALAERIVQKRR
jgi:ornithine cyclodeaminase/alanine dehydrogenase-like protein (mu-crystallin family)